MKDGSGSSGAKASGSRSSFRPRTRSRSLYPGATGTFAMHAESGTVEMAEGVWDLQPPWPKIPATWGKRSAYNARVEGSEEQGQGIENMRAYGQPFKKRRCVIAMASYYENADVEGVGHYVEVSPTEDEVFLIAGIWEPGNFHTGDVPTYSLITTASNGELAGIHTRRLARLEDDMLKDWFDPDAPIDLLKALLQPREVEPILIVDVQRPCRSKNRKVEANPSLFDSTHQFQA